MPDRQPGHLNIPEIHPDFHNIVGIESKELSEAFGVVGTIIRAVEEEAASVGYRQYCDQYLLSAVVPTEQRREGPECAIFNSHTGETSSTHAIIMWGPFLQSLNSLLPAAYLTQLVGEAVGLKDEKGHYLPVVLFSSPFGKEGVHLKLSDQRKLAKGQLDILADPGIRFLLSTLPDLSHTVMAGYSGGAGLITAAGARISGLARELGRDVQVQSIVVGAPPTFAGGLPPLLRAARSELTHNQTYFQRQLDGFFTFARQYLRPNPKSAMRNLDFQFNYARGLAGGPFLRFARAALETQRSVQLTALWAGADATQPRDGLIAALDTLRSEWPNQTITDIGVNDAHHAMGHDTYLLTTLLYAAFEQHIKR